VRSEGRCARPWDFSSGSSGLPNPWTACLGELESSDQRTVFGAACARPRVAQRSTNSPRSNAHIPSATQSLTLQVAIVQVGGERLGPLPSRVVGSDRTQGTLDFDEMRGSISPGFRPRDGQRGGAGSLYLKAQLFGVEVS